MLFDTSGLGEIDFLLAAFERALVGVGSQVDGTEAGAIALWREKMDAAKRQNEGEGGAYTEQRLIDSFLHTLWCEKGSPAYYDSFIHTDALIELGGDVYSSDVISRCRRRAWDLFSGR